MEKEIVVVEHLRRQKRT